MVQPKVYEKEIEPNLEEGNTLCFSHGFNITYEQIKPRKDNDVIMVAPKGPGSLVRREFKEGFGVPALIAVAQDYSGKAKEKVLALAKGIGATRAGVVETTFDEETFTDLFGEQTILVGATVEMVKATFETLVDAGFQPELAYFECLHELKLIVDLIQEGGIEYMYKKISDTAEYGARTRGPIIINENVRKILKDKILADILDGKFAQEWISEQKAGYPKMTELRKTQKGHPIEEVGDRIRKMFKKY